jgi:hypothetical protein
MAKELDGFPEQSRCELVGWGRFLDGKVWSIRRGVDFHTETNAVRAGVNMAKFRLGLDGVVRTRIVDKTPGKEAMVVQWVPESDPACKHRHKGKG